MIAHFLHYLKTLFVFIIVMAILLIQTMVARAQQTPFDGLSEQEVGSFVCPVFASAESEVVADIYPDLSQAISECHDFLSIVQAEATIKASLANKPYSLGANLMERFNKWFYQYSGEGATVFVTIKNPYSVKLFNITAEYANGDCGTATRYTYFDIMLVEPLAPKRTALVKFNIPDGIMSGDGCLNLIGAIPERLTQSSQRVFSDISTLAKAGQWHAAGLLYERAIQSRVTAPVGFHKKFFANTIRSVQSLPANLALENRNGYDLLRYLDAGGKRFLKKIRLYEVAAKPEIIEALRAEFTNRSPIVNFTTLATKLSDKSSRAERDDAWSSFEGKTLTVRGKIINVKAKGFFSNAQVEIQTQTPETTVLCTVKDILNDSVVSLRKGMEIECQGKLYEYTLIFGILSLFINDAEYAK